MEPLGIPRVALNTTETFICGYNFQSILIVVTDGDGLCDSNELVLHSHSLTTMAIMSSWKPQKK